ncbi:hypothetical protein ColLi_10920 [Colletotrichum liriopes]|uniref:Uncharacterized protein n=1 Tax=Colletotrichum liriopes TaxID=708192 RepID=A0AA37GXF3_9PEZI|nr:hypothetical protein ColLi_10920 [Colletotrichum liriopes]
MQNDEASTRREMTAEMAAIIWDQHAWPNLADEFFLVLVRFTGRYISYISNGCNKTLPPSDCDFTSDHLVRFQTFGPFRLSNRKHMTSFVEIMIGLAVEQMQDTVGQAAIQQLLQ